MKQLRRLFYSDKTDVLIILFLLIAGLKFTFGLQNAMDIARWDEHEYIFRGVKFAQHGWEVFPGAQFAPFYSLWYYMLSLFQPLPVELYYLNQKVLTILSPVLVFFLLRRYKVSLIISVVVSSVFLISKANLIGFDTKVNHFALVIVLLSFIVASYTKRTTHAILLVCLGALLASFVRPEFFLTYLLLIPFYLAVVIIKRKNIDHLRELIAVGALALVSFVLLSSLGMPAFGPEGGREFAAFAHHFSTNWAEWYGDDPDRLDSNGMRAIATENFGDASSIPQAILNNPILFLYHTTYNLGESIKLLPVLFLSNYLSGSAHPLLSSDIPLSIKRVEPYLLLGLLCLFLLVHLGRLANGRFSEVSSTVKRHKTVLLLLGFYILTAYISVVVNRPYERYLVLPGLLLIIVVTLIMAGKRVDEGQPNYGRAVFIGFFLVLLTPYFAGQGPIDDRDNVETIMFINNLEIEEQVNLLEGDGVYDAYLDGNFRMIRAGEKDASFTTFLRDKDIDMIVASDSLDSSTQFRNDEEWQRFSDSYTDLGYAQIDIPETNRKLIMDKELLEQVRSQWFLDHYAELQISE